MTKLQLDNNRITEIKNLNHLTSLTWLGASLWMNFCLSLIDLSFNQIKKIEGLDQLTKLTDLSLFHNEITVVENLENLVELKVLSIGDNQIKNLDKLVHYLRGFKKLRVLNLKGNRAIYDDPECRNYVIAFVKQLRYLDYKLITDEEVRLVAACRWVRSVTNCFVFCAETIRSQSARERNHAVRRG